MTAQLINGRELAATIRANIATQVSIHCQSGQKPPCLAVILVGEDPPSTIYVKNKRQACEEVGIHSIYYHLNTQAPETELMELICQLNHDPTVQGILLQLPLPAHINTDKILELIDPKKDVDGFHPYNLGRLAQRRPLFRPCTPYGVMEILKSIQQPYHYQHAVIVGASNIVGRPMALELLAAGCTITVCHRLTQNLPYHVQQADILVSATGQPHLIQGHWIKPGATVIDIGITRLSDGTLRGDVEFDKAVQYAKWITPVPGGVGPMTVAMLLKNTLLAAIMDLA